MSEKRKSRSRAAKASTSRAKEVLSETIDKTTKAAEFARERYGIAAESLREGYGRTRKDLDKLQDDVTAYVSDNPGRSILIAGAIGFFIGFLISRERRR